MVHQRGGLHKKLLITKWQDKTWEHQRQSTVDLNTDLCGISGFSPPTRKKSRPLSKRWNTTYVKQYFVYLLSFVPCFALALIPSAIFVYDVMLLGLCALKMDALWLGATPPQQEGTHNVRSVRRTRCWWAQCITGLQRQTEKKTSHDNTRIFIFCYCLTGQIWQAINMWGNLKLWWVARI